MSVTKDFLAAVQKSPAILGALVSSGVVKLREISGIPIYTMGWGVVDQEIATFLTERPVESVTELVELGMTPTRMGHEILGLPKNDATLQAGADGTASISSMFGLVVKSRLGAGVDGNAQKLCNSEKGQWLVGYKYDGQMLYATTRNPSMVETAFTEPRTARQVNARVKEVVTAMTVAHRIPGAAAQFIASADVQAESLALARQTTFAQITEGKSDAEVRELESEVAALSGKYRTANAEKFKAISESEPAVSKPKGRAADAA